MAGGSAGEPSPRVLHLNAFASEQTLIGLWQAGYGEHLRGLGNPFRVVFDSEGIALHAMGVSIDPDVTPDPRAFIPWSHVDRVGLASVSLASVSTPERGGSQQGSRQAITVTANSVTVPFLVYSPVTGPASALSGRASSILDFAQTINALRGMPGARVNPVDLMREAVPELDPTLRRLAADPELPPRTADELLGAVVRREPVDGASSARVRSLWRLVRGVAATVAVAAMAFTVGAGVLELEPLRIPASFVFVLGGFAIFATRSRIGTADRIVMSELEAGYTLSSAGPVQVDQLDPATSIVIRRAGERALTPVEEKRARSAARLLDAGGPESPPTEWAVVRMRQIISRGEDPEVAPSVVPEVLSSAAQTPPVWGTGSGDPLPARYRLLEGRHSRSVAWYRRQDVAARRVAEHGAGYTVSRTHRADLDQVDPVTGYVIRPAGAARLSRSQERAAMARVRMLPPLESGGS
jgi:hypothetical protein